MKRLIAVFALSACCFAAWSGASAEGASSARGRYLAGSGVIVPSAQVDEGSYVAYVNYRYPKPTELLGVSVYTGHRQVSGKGQEEIVHVGVQARELPFEELRPLNFAFVIDRSGSMSSANKLDWVKKAFDIFISSVRDKDFVSLVIFDNVAEVVFPSTRMSSAEQRSRFRSAVSQIQTRGGTNVPAGVELGYAEVMKNFRSGYTNRVLLLTDGLSNVGSTGALLDMADSFRERGVNLSAIGVGTGYDPKLMEELARRGGGSSRFIADAKEMEKTFGSELDRMAVPAARDLRMKLEFRMPVEVLGTWGYENRVSGDTITYALPTLHHRDYETILARVRILPTAKHGPTELARFTLEYKDVEGVRHAADPVSVLVECVDAEEPVAGFSDGMVMRSGTMLAFAQALKRIGDAYYAGRSELDQVNSLRNSMLRGRSAVGADYHAVTSPEIAELEGTFKGRLRTALEWTVAMKKELVNVHLRSDDQGFDDEIRMMDEYIRILSKELEVSDADAKRVGADEEMLPGRTADRPLSEQLHNLFQEILLEVSQKKGGAIAVSGFAAKGPDQPRLVTLLNEMGVVELAKADHLTLVERSRLDEILREQQLAASDLMDTNKAVSVGKVLAARYILTGSVIEMPGSVVIFGRVVNVETAEVESAAQVIVGKTSEVTAML